MARQHHLWTIDAIEEDAARIEVDGDRIVTLPIWLLPADAGPGEVLRVTHDREADRSTLTIVRDEEATRLAYEESARQVERMQPGGDGGGDILL